MFSPFQDAIDILVQENKAAHLELGLLDFKSASIFALLKHSSSLDLSFKSGNPPLTGWLLRLNDDICKDILQSQVQAEWLFLQQLLFWQNVS